MAEQAASKPKKKRSIKAIIVVATIFATALIGVTGFYFYKNKTATPDFKVDSNTLNFVYAQDTVDSKKKPESFIKHPSIELPKMRIPVINDNGVQANLQFRAFVKIKNEKVFEEFKFKLPYIVDSIFIRIFTLYSNLWIPSVSPDESIFRSHVLKAIEDIFGENRIENLYIKEFYIEK